uniref:Uncharacterized protein n=1 Tax=viral metagenome TaxID=1070528 RepID=A0A6M3J2J7_9ZZZZ
MAFDRTAFLSAKWEPRTESVPVPDMAEFFGGSKKDAKWKVRGLEGVEVGRAKAAAARNRNVAAILEGLVSPSKKEIASSMAKLVGVGDDVPDDIAIRIEHFIMGSVEPEADLELAKTVCRSFPVEFYTITTKILELTGAGHLPGKPKPSGKKEK